MSGNLGDMQVSFSADISNLTSSVSQAQSQLAGFASAATSFSDQITQLFSTANVSDFTGQIDGATSSLTTLGTEVASTTSSLQEMGPSANLSGFVSDIDVAQAQLVLLQSKAADAATALQEMQAEASASGDYSGIAEAQAQLVLLQGKAQDAAASLQELQAAESDTSGSSSFGDAVSGMMSNLGNFGSSIGSGISSLLSMGGELGMTVMGLQMLGNMAQQTASALLTPAATAETTQLSFTTLMHSASAAKDEMTALNTYAASTPMQTQWVDDAASKFLAFGFNVKSVIPDINAIGDSLSGLGKLSAASLNSIVDIFGKIQAQGKLTGGDMMQLSDAGIPAWKALSDAMGKPIPVLQQMVSKGLIPAKDALPALQKGMEGIFGGGMAKQAQTFSGIISTISSDWQIAMSKLSGPLLKMAEDGLGKLSNILGSQQFQDFAANVGQKIADVLTNIGNFVRTTLVPDFIAFGTYIGSLVPVVTPVFASIWSGLQAVGNFLQQNFMPVWQQLGTLFSTQIVPLWGQLQTAIGPMIPMFEQIAGLIGGSIYAAFVIGMGVIRGFIGAISGLLTGVVLVVDGMSTAWQGGFQFVESLTSFFVDLFTGKWNNLGTDLGNIAGGIVKVWQGMWTATEGIFVSAINGLIGLVNGFVAGIATGINSVLTATGHAAIHVGTIPMLSAPSVASGNYSNMFTPTASQAQGVTPQGPTKPASTAANPFTQWLNSFNSMMSSASATATSTKTMASSIPAAVNSAADTTSAATTSGHTKTQAQIQKAADSANAQRLRLSTDQQKALTDSSSSAVQQLVDKSKAAAVAGDTSTASFYASQADQLAAQQKAAATKATNAKKVAARKAATAKVAAAKKAATARATAARATAKKKTATVSSPKTSTRGTSTGTTTTRSTSTGVTPTRTSTGAASSTGGATLGTATTTTSGTTTTATGTPGATDTGQPLIIIVELEGQQLVKYVGNTMMKQVRLKTGLKV